MVEELDHVDPDGQGLGPLLGLAQRPALRGQDRVDAGLAARDEEVGACRAALAARPRAAPGIAGGEPQLDNM
jgi:hypothetical protein